MQTEPANENIVTADTFPIPGKPEEQLRLMFGVESRTPFTDLLQNNLNLFEWVTRNKPYPNFCGRHLTGKNPLTKEEIHFLHLKGCKIALICDQKDISEAADDMPAFVRKIGDITEELGIPYGTAIFLDVREEYGMTTANLREYASGILELGYIPGFKADTDAKYSFDREYSRGVRNFADTFAPCLVWANTPVLKEYDRITTTHTIPPENWIPYAPSGITRNQIALWQYGENCHPIEDDHGIETVFNVILVRNEYIIIDRMF